MDTSPEGRVREGVWGQVAGVVVGRGGGWVQAERRQGGHAEILGRVVGPEAPQIVLGHCAGGHHVVHRPLQAAGGRGGGSELRACGPRPAPRHRLPPPKGSPRRKPRAQSWAAAIPWAALAPHWPLPGGTGLLPAARGNRPRSQAGGLGSGRQQARCELKWQRPARLPAQGRAAIWRLSGSAGVDSQQPEPRGSCPTPCPPPGPQPALTSVVGSGSPAPRS